MSWTNSRKTLFIALIGSFATLSCFHAASIAAPAADPKGDQAPPSKPAPELGMWVWQSKYIQDASERRKLIDFSKQRKISRLLIQIHFEKDQPKVAFPAEMRAFLSEAADAGIKVEALDGEKGMGLADRRADTLSRLDAILTFQAAQPAGRGFAGVHYDIEPYLSARWKAGDVKNVILENLETDRAIWQEVKKRAPELTVAYDIPAWYDKRGESVTVEFEGQRKNYQEHIQDLSDYVGIMSYRTKADGPNSVTAISKAALDYAEKTGKKIYPSLETNPAREEASITFFGTPPELVLQTAGEIRKDWEASPAFGGVFLHDYPHLRKLLESKPEETPAPHG